MLDKIYFRSPGKGKGDLATIAKVANYRGDTCCGKDAMVNHLRGIMCHKNFS